MSWTLSSWVKSLKTPINKLNSHIFSVFINFKSYSRT